MALNIEACQGLNLDTPAALRTHIYYIIGVGLYLIVKSILSLKISRTYLERLSCTPHQSYRTLTSYPTYWPANLINELSANFSTSSFVLSTRRLSPLHFAMILFQQLRNVAWHSCHCLSSRLSSGPPRNGL